MQIGLFTPASPIGPVELARGVAKLRDAGFVVRVHDQAMAQHFMYAGTDAQRAGALWDLATDDAVDALWCTRGGYGCTRLLPLLDELTKQHGPPPRKLLVGYSDVTVLHEYARTRWGWATLHADMPATGSFTASLAQDEFDATVKLVKGETLAQVGPLFGDTTMRFFTAPPAENIEGELLGGNLATWNYLTGTPYQPASVAGKLLFFEDVGEGFHKMDAYFTQLAQAGGLDGVAGVILGGFHDCDDTASTVLAQEDAPADGGAPPRRPVRPTFTEAQALEHITTPLAEKYGFPVAWKLPVTHGPDHWPLPLGATYRLTPDGRLSLRAWDWLAPGRAHRPHGPQTRS